MPERILNNEFYIFLTKVILPAFLAIGVKVAIEMKKSKVKISLLNICLSMVIGISGAYFSSGYILNNISSDNIPIAIAIIAITSEKIGAFLIYKLDVDMLLRSLINVFFDAFSNKKK